MDFSGHTVIVTGASMGVGKATAAAFHREGANVVLVARREGPLREAAAELSAPERVMTRAADVTDNEALRALVAESVERFGKLTGLVNNAGAHFRGNVELRTAEELSLMVDANLRAPIVLSSLALPHHSGAGGIHRQRGWSRRAGAATCRADTASRSAIPPAGPAFPRPVCQGDAHPGAPHEPARQ